MPHEDTEYINFYEVAPSEADTADVDAEETDPESALEDLDVSFDEAEAEPDEASDEELDDDADTEDESEEAEDEPEVTKEVQSDEDTTKARNKEQAERRIQAKQEREQSLLQQQQEYIAEHDAEDPRDLAVRQLQVDAYNNKVDGNTNKLTNAYEKAIKDFDILSDASPEIQAELNDALDSFQARYVMVDTYGNPTEVRGDLYAYLQTKADSIKQLTGIGARKQAESKGKEKSKTLVTPGRAPKEGKKNPMLDGFDEEAGRW